MAAANDERQDRELIVAPNEYCYTIEETKGEVVTYTGPFKTSLSATEQPVIFDPKSKPFAKFKKVSRDQAIQIKAIAPEGYYLVLKNPARGVLRRTQTTDAVPQENDAPTTGKETTTPRLETGRKINIPGPVAIALWPGQIVKVLKGHHLRSNQYLVARVYEDTVARANLQTAILQPAEDGAKPKEIVTAHDLTMGKLFIIKGTDVSYYVPPTGIEVVADADGNLVRGAVTLERLEYALLKDENGNKRYERGPSVVFPGPTEVFSMRELPDGTKTRKFRATELTKTSGIHVKVTADYTDSNNVAHKMGDELFITGDTNEGSSIYFPREEHAIIKYGDQEVHYAVAVPEGEARYVMNRNSGKVALVKGPRMLLPDPREEVIVKRVLTPKECELLYPGNAEALAYNLALAGIDLSQEPTGIHLRDQMKKGLPAAVGMTFSTSLETHDAYQVQNAPARGFQGDQIDRKNQYREPRSITLNNKYQGAVTTAIQTGFAILLVRKNGERRVASGPQTTMLEYDESPQDLVMSTGKPKTTDKLFHTAFLLVNANQVGDVVQVETKDFVNVELKLSYRLNFEGDPNLWFNVENYVKFLCDRMRSRLKGAVRGLTIEEFYATSETILRKIVLGEKVVDGKREGTTFPENGMRVYDLEVLTVKITNPDIEKLIVGSQREAINNSFALLNERRKVDFVKSTEQLKQERATAEAATAQAIAELQTDSIQQDLAIRILQLDADLKKFEAREFVRLAEQEAHANEAASNLLIEKNKSLQALEMEEQEMRQRIAELAAETTAVVEKSKAVSPDLIAALTAFGERNVAEKALEAMAPLSLLTGGKPVLEIVGEIFKGTPFAKHLMPPAANGMAKRAEPQASPSQS